jgi:hypothetical protein
MFGCLACMFCYMLGCLACMFCYSGCSYNPSIWNASPASVMLGVTLMTMQVVKLSELAKGMTRSVTCNVNGVADVFLIIGRQRAAAIAAAEDAAVAAADADAGTIKGAAEVVTSTYAIDATQGAYFLGKALWDKGHAALMDLLEAHAGSSKDAGLMCTTLSVDVCGE